MASAPRASRACCAGAIAVHATSRSVAMASARRVNRARTAAEIAAVAATPVATVSAPEARRAPLVAAIAEAVSVATSTASASLPRAHGARTAVRSETSASNSVAFPSHRPRTRERVPRATQLRGRCFFPSPDPASEPDGPAFRNLMCTSARLLVRPHAESPDSGSGRIAYPRDTAAIPYGFVICSC